MFQKFVTSFEFKLVRVSNPLFDMYTAVKRKQDVASNCVKCLILKKLKNQICKQSHKIYSKFKLGGLQKAAHMDTNEIIVHYKTTKSTVLKPPADRIEKVRDFYNQDTILRQLPYKNLTQKINNSSGVYHCVPVQVMEITLKKAFVLFCLEYPDVKISERSLSIFALRIFVWNNMRSSYNVVAPNI